MRCRLAYSPADALPLTISCSSKSRLVLTFLVLPFWYLLTRVVPTYSRRAVKWLCVCWYGACLQSRLIWQTQPTPYMTHSHLIASCGCFDAVLRSSRKLETSNKSQRGHSCHSNVAFFFWLIETIPVFCNVALARLESALNAYSMIQLSDLIGWPVFHIHSHNWPEFDLLFDKCMSSFLVVWLVDVIDVNGRSFCASEMACYAIQMTDWTLRCFSWFDWWFDCISCDWSRCKCLFIPSVLRRCYCVTTRNC